MRRPLPLVCALALSTGALLALAAPSLAAFPGRNGRIAVSYFDDPGGTGSFPAREGIGLLRASRGPSQKRADVTGCTRARRGDGCPLSYSTPAFSPDGRWIAFDAGRRIAVVRLNGTGRRLLPAAGRDAANPTWSPGGGRILFDSARKDNHGCPRIVACAGTRDLYVVAASGSGRARRIVRDAANPSWSVRGLLAFERPSGTTWRYRARTWVSRTSGARAHVVSRGAGWGPDFSPAGLRLVYYSLPVARLAVVGADGQGTRRLAAATESAYEPAFSPDGRLLAWPGLNPRPVQGGVTTSAGIYVSRADGTHAHQIARDRSGPRGSYSFSSYSPSWQPLPPFRDPPCRGFCG